MEKRLNSLWKLGLAFTLIFCFHISEAQVFKWKGLTKEWNDPQNWILSDGSVPVEPPSHKNPVELPDGVLNPTIEISGVVQIKSLSKLGNQQYQLISKKGAKIEIENSFLLFENVSVSENIDFNLNASSNAFYAVPEGLKNQIRISNPDAYSEFSIASQRGSCPFFTLIPNPTAPTCNGFEDGIASVEVPTDGVGPFTYQWVGGPSTRQWTNLGAGTYTIIVVDLGQGGLPCNIDVFVNEPGPLSLFALNGVPPTCSDVCNGQANPIVIGGNGGYTLTWSSGETGFNATALCATFTLDIVDQAGCMADTTVTFNNVPPPIVIDETISNITCFGDNDGAIDIEVSGGTGGYAYSWTGPGGFVSNSEDISGLSPGDYTIEITDGNSCTQDATFSVTENPELTLSTAVIDNLCANGTIGAIDLIISGGLAPFAIAWQGPNGFTSSDEDIVNLESGLYEVTVTDAGGCIRTTQATVDEPMGISVSFSIDDLLCFEDNSGEISASASGGVAPYSYSWTGPNGFSANGPGITGLEAGVYTVEIEDQNGCLFTDQANVNQPAPLALSITEGMITCQGGADGSLDLTVSGGTLPYSFEWSGPSGFTSTLEDISGLNTGTYVIEVTDGNGCIETLTYDLVAPDAIQVSGTATSPACNGGNTGSIDISVTNGTPPYSYSWTGPGGFTSNAEDISGLAPGTYNVTVTDANSCFSSATFTVNNPPQITASFVTTNVLCFNGNSGSIQTTVSGGTAPYTFLWLGPNGFISTSQNISGLTAGSYSVQITDVNGCTRFQNVTISQPGNLSVSNVLQNVSCFGFSNGSVNITPSGATPPYTYSWTGPSGFTASTQDVFNVPAGAYSVVITDANGCTFTRNYTVNQPAPLTINRTITDVVCAGDSTGAINITPTGGTPGYNFDWSGPGGFSTTSEDISDLIAGSYTINLTDNRGCTADSTFTISETFELILTLTKEDISCFGEGDGSIDLSVSGGTSPYTINWSGPNGFSSSSEDLSSLEAGTYQVEVADDNGCQQSGQVNILEPAELFLSINSSTISCFGLADGSATASVSGGSAPYSYSWTGPDGFSSNASSISGLNEGSYQLTITDAEGCFVTGSVDISEPDAIDISIDSVQPDCIIDNGELSALVTGGTVAGDYSYVWTSGGNTVGTDPVLQNLDEGVYTLTVTDDNGCTAQETINLLRDSFNIAAAVSNVSCPEGNDGEIILVVTDGTPPFTFSWTGPNGFVSTDPSIFNLSSGTYVVDIEDDAGCSILLAYDVAEPSPISFQPIVENESCAGLEDGIIDVNPQGGTAPYTYSWSSPSGFTASTQDISNLSPADYTLEITDSQGCIADTVITLNSATAVLVDITGTDLACFGGASGSANSSVSGGNSPYTYSWTGPNGFSSADPSLSDLEAGLYILTAFDSNGCSGSDTIEISQPAEIEISVSIQSSSCLQSDGLAVASAIGGTGDLSFTWFDDGGNFIVENDSLQNIPSGVYSIVVTDELNCSSTEIVTVSDLDGAVDGVVSNPLCSGGTSGSVDITVSDGTPPFTYEWLLDGTPFSADEDITDLSSGNYVVIVTDVNGCVYTAGFDLIDPPAIAVSADLELVSCAGDDGNISITASNANPPVNVAWTGPDGFTGSGTEISNLSIGIYSYDLTDASGCEAQGDIELTALDPVSLSLTSVNPICAGSPSGEIQLDISGGQGPYTIGWTGPDGYSSSQQNIGNLISGTYAVEVTDQNGCIATAQMELIDPSPITATFDSVEPDCNQPNGSITAIPSGGTGSYTFVWTDESNTVISTAATASNLLAGNYTIAIQDENSCLLEEVFSLSNPGGNISAAVTPETCFGDGDGAIDMTIADVTPPYSISWIGPDGFSATIEDITSLSAGIYTYEIISAEGCIYTGEVEVTSPEELNVVLNSSGSCEGENNGFAEAIVTGGSEPYTISWTGPDGFVSSNPAIDNLAQGSYSLDIIDANGCAVSEIVEIIESPAIDLGISSSDVSCFSAGDGSVDLTITGGISPFTITWMGPDNFTSDQEDLNGLEAGTYEVSVMDEFGCSATAEVLIEEPEELAVEENVEASGCGGENNSGSISLFPSGGTPGYGVSWTGPDGFVSSFFDITGLGAGTYEYIVTDAIGCSLSGMIEIIDVEELAIEVNPSDLSCFEAGDGAIDLTLQGGVSPYQVSWVGPDGFNSNEESISNLSSGQYLLTVIDAAGCNEIVTVEVSQPEPLTVDLNVVDATCTTLANGAISPVVTGGTAPFTYSWDGPNGFESSLTEIDNLLPGQYILSLSDVNGCSVIDTAFVSAALPVTADAGNDFIICRSDLPFSLTGASDGGVEFYWIAQGEDTLSTELEVTISSAFTGVVELVFVADNGLCSASDTIEIDVLPGPEVDAGEDLEVFAEELFTLGGNPTSPTAQSYSWFPNPTGSLDTSVANPQGFLLESQEFVVIATDQNGCSSSDTVFVEVLPDLTITSGFTPNGDGVNDTWIIDNINLFPNSVVHVFNRWGTQVFESNGYNANVAWDGTYNGSEVPVGTYYYTIELNDERFPDPFTGPLTIHR